MRLKIGGNKDENWGENEDENGDEEDCEEDCDRPYHLIGHNYHRWSPPLDVVPPSSL